MYRALCTDLQILVHVVRIPDESGAGRAQDSTRPAWALAVAAVHGLPVNQGPGSARARGPQPGLARPAAPAGGPPGRASGFLLNADHDIGARAS